MYFYELRKTEFKIEQKIDAYLSVMYTMIAKKPNVNQYASDSECWSGLFLEIICLTMHTAKKTLKIVISIWPSFDISNELNSLKKICF